MFASRRLLLFSPSEGWRRFASAGQGLRTLDVGSSTVLEAFDKELQEGGEVSNQPAILEGLLADWPALTWTMKDLEERCGDLVVPVERSLHGGDYRLLYAPPATITGGNSSSGGGGAPDGSSGQPPWPPLGLPPQASAATAQAAPAAAYVYAPQPQAAAAHAYQGVVAGSAQPLLQQRRQPGGEQDGSNVEHSRGGGGGPVPRFEHDVPVCFANLARHIREKHPLLAARQDGNGGGDGVTASGSPHITSSRSPGFSSSGVSSNGRAGDSVAHGRGGAYGSIARASNGGAAAGVADRGEHGGSGYRAAAEVWYLAQKDVAEVLPPLAKHGLRVPPLQRLRERLHQTSVWLGPGGTRTPLHRDPYSNVLCQVFGSKYVRLYDPKHGQRLYPFAGMALRNTSQVDVERPNARCFPLFEGTPYKEALILPGQAIYMPRGWWHYVRSEEALGPSLSVSFWWAA